MGLNHYEVGYVIIQIDTNKNNTQDMRIYRIIRKEMYLILRPLKYFGIIVTN